jgi:hypothetical protein
LHVTKLSSRQQSPNSKATFQRKNQEMESVFKIIELFHEFEFGSEK